MYAKQIDELKEEVRSMLTQVSNNTNNGSKTAETINLINTLERLGVSYHFDKEIEATLDHIHSNSIFEEDHDLCAVALHFRVFRQHGYNISCGKSINRSIYCLYLSTKFSAMAFFFLSRSKFVIYSLIINWL